MQTESFHGSFLGSFEVQQLHRLCISCWKGNDHFCQTTFPLIHCNLPFLRCFGAVLWTWQTKGWLERERENEGLTIMGAECVCVCVCRVCVHVQKNIRETQARLVAVCSSILCVSPAAFFYPVPLCLLYPIQFNASQRRLCGFSGLLLLWRDETLLLDRSCKK